MEESDILSLRKDFNRKKEKEKKTLRIKKFR